MVRIPGVDLNVDIHGEHPHTVFVHGDGGDLRTWDGVWRALGDALPAVRYDLRGFGESHCSLDEPYKHADDLSALLDALDIAQCNLVGASMGGGIALNFTLDHPQRVDNLVLISPSIVGWEWSPAWRERWLPIVTHARHGDMATARRLWWEHPLFNTTRNSAAAGQLFDSMTRYAGQQWIHDSHVLMMPDIERLHELTTRTLLLSGGRDLEEFQLIAELIAAGAGNLRRIEAPTLGHMMHLEDPTFCAQSMLTFLQSSTSTFD